MSKWFIALAAIVILVLIGIYVFRVQPLVSDGYFIQEVNQIIVDDESATEQNQVIQKQFHQYYQF